MRLTPERETVKYESKKKYNCSSINRKFLMMFLSSNTEVLGFMMYSKDIILQLKCFP